MNEPRIGVALGAGAARGWTHIGVLRALENMGLKVSVVSGCSSGALVAASYVTGRLNVLEDLARRMTQPGMLRFVDLSFSGSGVIEGKWIADFVRDNIGNVAIEDIRKGFGTVATEHEVGREVWFTSGSLIDAVRASIALPGTMTPVSIGDRWLVDGALVNPVPVTLCRHLGADIVIAVNVCGDLTSPRPSELITGSNMKSPRYSSWFDRLTTQLNDKFTFQGLQTLGLKGDGKPAYMDVVGSAMFTVQNALTRHRIAVDQPDIVISPKVDHIGIMEFYKGSEAIARGMAAVRQSQARITSLIESRL